MAVHYIVTISDPERHLVHIKAVIQDIENDTFRVQMPTWTPGSYLVREYARHIRDVRAYGGDRELVCHKLDKLTWEINTGGNKKVVLSYTVYGYELTVRTNHIDSTHAHLTPAATFMFVLGREQAQSTIEIVAPDGWNITTGLERKKDTHNPTFIADTLDQLIDTPFEIGLQRRWEWQVDGKDHALVVWGTGNEDPDQLVADAKTIVEVQRDFWGSLPYQHYTFILLLGGPKSGGGLEHHNSTVLLLPRHIFRPKKNYERYLSLVSHEFFHTWNVKRLRAESLGPFDYTQENYTRLLWVMEGFTEYYTDIFLARAGLIDAERYLARLAQDMVTLQTTPGRLQQTVSEASLDAWIRLYRPDETTPNTTISYYLKGALVAFCLDMEIRKSTQGEKSLDDLMHYLFKSYPVDGPGIPELTGMIEAVQAIAPGDWQPFWQKYIDGVAELPFEEALHVVGLKPLWSYAKTHTNTDQPIPDLGVRTKTQHGHVTLTHVLDGGSAHQAGLAPHDELVAMDGWRIDADLLKDRLSDYTVGDTVTLTLFRNDVLMTISVTFVKPAFDSMKIVALEPAESIQKQQYATWLNSPFDEGEKAKVAPSRLGTEEIS